MMSFFLTPVCCEQRFRCYGFFSGGFGMASIMHL